MDPPLHSGVKLAVSWVDSTSWKPSKETKDADKVFASRFWDVLGILYIDYLEKGRIINKKYYIALLVCLKEEITKKWPQRKKKKKCSFTRQCTVSQVNCNDGKTTWIASTPTLFSRSCPQQVLAIWRPQINAPRKEIWL